MKNGKVKTADIPRKELVAAAKEMNQTLGLNPKIVTKVGEKHVPESEIIEKMVMYAKGYDDETGKYIAKNAVSRKDDALADSTWKVLELIGAVAPVASGKKGKPEKAEKKAGVEGKKLESKSTKELKKPLANRSAGRFPAEWKELKAHLESLGKDVSLARRYDQQLLKKQTLGEHIADSLKIQKELGVTRSITPHIKWRYEVHGWDFKDTRKFERDVDGVVYLIGISPDEAGRKLDMPGTAPKAEKSAKKVKKEEKVEKKAKKSEKAEKEEKSAKEHKKGKSK